MSIYKPYTHCVYLTIYKGNLLPPFYVGYTTIDKISRGYRGSVMSKRYKKIWNSELKNNPELFNTKIIKEFYNKNDAILYEEKVHVQLNVDENPLYINMIKSRHYWQNKGGYKLTEQQRKNRRWSDERKEKQRKITSELNKKRWANYTEDERKKVANKISKSNIGKKSKYKNIPRTTEDKQKISHGTKAAMDNDELRKHLSKKAKQRGINKLCCLSCKKVITAPNFERHIDSHNGIKRIWINNGEKQKYIKNNEPIPKNWKKGRLPYKK